MTSMHIKHFNKGCTFFIMSQKESHFYSRSETRHSARFKLFVEFVRPQSIHLSTESNPMGIPIESQRPDLFRKNQHDSTKGMYMFVPFVRNTLL